MITSKKLKDGRTYRSEQIEANIRIAKRCWRLTTKQVFVLQMLSAELKLSIPLGELSLLDGNWYITHAGLLRLARRRGCRGIQTRPLREFCDPGANKWVFRAVVYRSRGSKGFVGYGDADPSNVSPVVRAAEMRVAETRAVNRALRKSLRHRPLLGRRTRLGAIRCKEQGPARSSPRFSDEPRPHQRLASAARPALPVDPPAPARSPADQALRLRLLRDRLPARGQPRPP